MSEVEVAATNRLDRRRARTRAALIGAARQLITEGRATTASIQDITDTADIGFGSFYNHFDSKDELFRSAAQEVLEEWGDLIDRITAPIEDPREVFAASLRISGRLAWTHQEMAQILVHYGFGFVDTEHGLAPRALRDLTAANDAGLLDIENVPMALSMIGGSILALLQLRLDHPDLVTPESADQMALQLLRMIGIPSEEAAELTSRPLPAGTPISTK